MEPETAINFAISCVISVFFVGSSFAMWKRRHLAPVKQHQVFTIILSGLGGWIVLDLQSFVRDAVGSNTYPCAIIFILLLLFPPVYCYPTCLQGLDLYNHHRRGEVLIALGEARRNAFLGTEGNHMEEINKLNKELLNLNWRSSKTGKGLQILAMFIPTIILGIAAYTQLASTLDFRPQNYGCVTPLSVFLAYIVVCLIYFLCCIYLVSKLRQVQDAFNIKKGLLLVFKVQVIFTILYTIAISSPTINDILNKAYFSDVWVLVVELVITHFILCVQPTLETFGLRSSFWRETTVVMSESDITLPMVLQTPEGVDLFSQYLVREFSTENIEFWKEVQIYRQISLSDVAGDNISRAVYIYENFIKVGSRLEVNVASAVRSSIENAIRGGRRLGNVDALVFDKAQQEVISLMTRDSFPRFKKGELFESYIKFLKKGRNSDSLFHSAVVSNVRNSTLNSLLQKSEVSGISGEGDSVPSSPVGNPTINTPSLGVGGEADISYRIEILSRSDIEERKSKRASLGLTSAASGSLISQLKLLKKSSVGTDIGRTESP